MLTLTLCCVLASYDVTSAEARRFNLLDYIAARDDLNASEKKDWDQAVRAVFGGTALKDGSDEGVTVAKSVLSGAIFFNIPAKEAATAAYDAYHDTARWVPPPIAINYQLLAFQGRKPAATARQLAYDFPRYYNEELAPELTRWWAENLDAGKIPPLGQSRVRDGLEQTRVLMRPLLLNKLYQAAELQGRVQSGDGAARGALDELGRQIREDFRGVGKAAGVADESAGFYSRYKALAGELKQTPRAAPAGTDVVRPAPPPRQAPPSSDVRPAPPAAVVPARPGFLDALRSAVQGWLGVPYLWAGTTKRGVDCSAFVQAVFREAFRIDLPRNARDQYSVGVPVNQPQLAPGDLVFFDTLERGRITHVAVFVGDGQIAHASSSHGVTRADLSKRYYQHAYWGSKRVVQR